MRQKDIPLHMFRNRCSVPTTVFIDKIGKVGGEAVVGAKVEEYKQHVEDYLNEQK